MLKDTRATESSSNSSDNGPPSPEMKHVTFVLTAHKLSTYANTPDPVPVRSFSSDTFTFAWRAAFHFNHYSVSFFVFVNVIRICNFFFFVSVIV